MTNEMDNKTQSMKYTDYLKAQQELNEIRQASVRGWGVCITHFLLAPAASVYYGVKTQYWKPTLIATAVALSAVPLSMVDFGFTLSVAPPITSAALIISNTNQKRKERGFLTPEQAEFSLYEKTKG